MNDGNNNGQLRIANATSVGACKPPGPKSLLGQRSIVIVCIVQPLPDFVPLLLDLSDSMGTSYFD